MAASIFAKEIRDSRWHYHPSACRIENRLNLPKLPTSTSHVGTELFTVDWNNPLQENIACS